MFTRLVYAEWTSRGGNSLHGHWIVQGFAHRVKRFLHRRVRKVDPVLQDLESRFDSEFPLVVRHRRYGSADHLMPRKSNATSSAGLMTRK